MCTRRKKRHRTRFTHACLFPQLQSDEKEREYSETRADYARRRRRLDRLYIHSQKRIGYTVSLSRVSRSPARRARDSTPLSRAPPLNPPPTYTHTNVTRLVQSRREVFDAERDDQMRNARSSNRGEIFSRDAGKFSANVSISGPFRGSSDTRESQSATSQSCAR